MQWHIQRICASPVKAEIKLKPLSVTYIMSNASRATCYIILCVIWIDLRKIIFWVFLPLSIWTRLEKIKKEFIFDKENDFNAQRHETQCIYRILFWNWNSDQTIWRHVVITRTLIIDWRLGITAPCDERLRISEEGKKKKKTFTAGCRARFQGVDVEHLCIFVDRSQQHYHWSIYPQVYDS
jgi:hypothetical protein